MKKFTKWLLSGLVLLSNLMPLSAMETPEEQNMFLKSTITDIQNLAKDLSQDGEFEYQIVAMPTLVEKCLQVLGLNGNNTPLDVRYHSELFKDKLPANTPLYNIVSKAYNQLIVMLSAIDYYTEEIGRLVAMSFNDIQTAELEDKDKSVHYQFMKYHNQLVDSTITLLKEKNRQYLVNSQAGLPIAIQTILNLPMDASRRSVEMRYNKYIASNSLNKLIALQKIQQISRQDLKNRLQEVARVKEAYTHYLEGKK